MYCLGRFSDIVFRHLYFDRDLEFANNSTELLDSILKDPLVIDEVTGKKIPITNHDILARFYKKIGVLT